MASRPLPDPALAKALIRSLTRGTSIARGARFIHAGQQAWLGAQLEMLDEVAEDATAETKFVRGAYGAGKSHFLSVVQDHARERGWVTSHVECKVDHVEIDRFETLYPRIVEKLAARETDGSTEPSAGRAHDQVAVLLDKWCKRILQRIGIREDGLSRPFDAENRVFGHFERHVFRSGLPTPFVQGALAYCRATLASDSATAAAFVEWLKGGERTLQLPARYVANPKLPPTGVKDIVYRPIGKGTARDAMRALLWLIRDAGYSGLVLCIDEVEELARLPNQKRQDQALQALREFVDHAGGEGAYMALCMYLAATPEMFENEKYFPRYDALATRIQPISGYLNWRGPVIDLEKSPLARDELVAIARAIADVYVAAYGAFVVDPSGHRIAQTAAEAALASRVRLAKPRLLARLLVDELERARAEGASYLIASDLGSQAVNISNTVLEGQRA